MLSRSKRIRKAGNGAEKAARDERERVMAVSAAIGLPDAQRCPERVSVVDADMGSRQQANVETIRRLTKAERLHRSGTIDATQLAAINLYVSALEAAYGSCIKATSYGDGGSSPTGAASAAHARQLDRIGEDYRYRRARATLLPHHVGPFERIVVDGADAIDVGAEMHPTLGRTSAYDRIRALLRTCCDRLCVEFAGELGIAPRRAHLAQTMVRMNEHVRTTRAVAERPISDAISVQLLDLDRGAPISVLVAPLVLAELVRENALDAEPDAWGGYPLLVRETWNWGWIVQREMA